MWRGAGGGHARRGSAAVVIGAVETTEGESVRCRDSGSGSDGSGGGVIFHSGGGVGAAVAHSSLVAHRGDSW
ncbi:hypothetical protein G5I_12101 [Acromyrmex echinatior]|uniref:Uncharacterized protein n=1 Tax=Acromyrmex echinatior TaxID=103372 RepID=F4X1H1_ACREC|nr:hypothetical protein G5I_12101 [Acromyrmex echinatior]